MNSTNVLHSDGLLHTLNQSFEAVCFADVVAGRESMSSIHANAEWQLRTGAHDLIEMFEAVADAITLPGRVLQQDAERLELQSLTRNLQTHRAPRNPVGFARATRTARMDYEIVHTQQERALNFLAKRLARLLQH